MWCEESVPCARGRKRKEGVGICVEYKNRREKCTGPYCTVGFQAVEHLECNL